MNLSKFAFLSALVILAGGCFEPEPTPLGPDVIGGELPVEAIVLRIGGADSLGLAPFAWEELLPLFEPEMLYCGFDASTGFRAEPLWVFDAAALAGASGELDDAFLRFYLPAANLDLTENGDNPDIEREVMVRLWELAEEPATDQALSAPLDLTSAAQVPLYSSGGEELDEPFRLEFVSGEGYRLPPDRVEAWIAAGERVTLALEWVDPAESGIGETGMIHIYSRLSAPLEGDSLTSAVLKVRFGANEGLSATSVLEGQALSRETSDSPELLLLGTGIARRVHLSLELPDSLRDSRIMIVRAQLSLYPVDSLLFGFGPVDRNDNKSGGLPALEGGLTMTVRAADDSVVGSAGLTEGEALTRILSVFEEPDSPGDIEDPAEFNLMTHPLELPLTTWVQDWANGDDENWGLTLELGGLEERARQAAWHIEPADSLRPILEIIYLRRPDFE